MNVNQDEEELGEFSGEVEGTERHSQELDVRCAQFHSDMDCGTPAGVNVETHTSAMLFTSDVTVAIDSLKPSCRWKLQMWEMCSSFTDKSIITCANNSCLIRDTPTMWS